MPKTWKETAVEVVVEGHHLRLTNLEKVMYPAVGFTKGEVVDYYRRIAPAMLPHIRGRPLTRIRFPHGVADKSFFEKQAPSHTPAWIPRAAVTHKEETVEYVVAGDVAALVWLANMAALELHPQLHLAAEPDRPTVMVFDLDPGLPAALRECCQVALWLREVLEALDLEAWPKVSGGKGLQVYVPLNTPGVGYADTKGYSLALARLLEKEHPAEVVSVMPKEKRKGKVFIDWSQNDPVKTTVAVYSLRARERPTVSLPVTWEEVEGAVEAGDASALVFTAPEALERVREVGDLFAPVAKKKQRLPKAPAG